MAATARRLEFAPTSLLQSRRSPRIGRRMEWPITTSSSSRRGTATVYLSPSTDPGTARPIRKAATTSFFSLLMATMHLAGARFLRMASREPSNLPTEPCIARAASLLGQMVRSTFPTTCADESIALSTAAWPALTLLGHHVQAQRLQPVKSSEHTRSHPRVLIRTPVLLPPPWLFPQEQRRKWLRLASKSTPAKWAQLDVPAATGRPAAARTWVLI